MNYNILILLSLFFINCSSYSLEVSLDPFFKEKKCDKKCMFPAENLTSLTVSTFPKTCGTVCANLRITQDCDLTENQLTSLFQNMKRLVGRLRVEGTNYTSSTFLAGLEKIECDPNMYGDVIWASNHELAELSLVNLSYVECQEIYAIYNSKMTKWNVPNLKKVEEATYKLKGGLPLNIYRNSPEFCLTSKQMIELMNIKGLDLDHIEAKYCVPKLDEKVCNRPEKGCVEIFGDVEIGADFDLQTLKSVEAIFGTLIINGTNLEDFSFLENLMYISQLEQGKHPLIVENNLSLVNMTFPRLKANKTLNNNSPV